MSTKVGKYAPGQPADFSAERVTRRCGKMVVPKLFPVNYVNGAPLAVALAGRGTTARALSHVLAAHARSMPGVFRLPGLQDVG